MRSRDKRERVLRDLCTREEIRPTGWIRLKWALRDTERKFYAMYTVVKRWFVSEDWERRRRARYRWNLQEGQRPLFVDVDEVAWLVAVAICSAIGLAVSLAVNGLLF